MSFGLNGPFGELYDVIIVMEEEPETTFTADVTVEGLTRQVRKKKSMKINHFEPEGLDTIGITFTNSSRNYAYVEIHNLDVE